MTHFKPTLTQSQAVLVDRIVEAVRRGKRVCLRGGSGSGRGTILRAAAAAFEREGEEDAVVLDAQSIDRLCWGIMRFSDGQMVRPIELAESGGVLFLDDADCQVRIREHDPIVIVGDYQAEVVLDVPAWDRDDIEAVAPNVAQALSKASAAVRNPRQILLADAYTRLGIDKKIPLATCRPDFMIARLLERIEIESPLSVDFLFAASELGTLPIATDWFVGWRGIGTEDAVAAAERLRQNGLIDPHSAGEWTAPAVVRAFVRRQMSVAFRKSAAQALGERLVQLFDDRPLDLLPHLTTLWKRLRGNESRLATEIWGRISPCWQRYGFQFHISGSDEASLDGDGPEANARSASDSHRFETLNVGDEADANGWADDSLPADADEATLLQRLSATEQILQAGDYDTAIRQLKMLSSVSWAFDSSAPGSSPSANGTARAAAVNGANNSSRVSNRINSSLAAACFQNRQYAEAAQLYEKLAAHVGRRAAARAWNNVGECHRADGKLVDAERALRRSIALFDQDATTDDVSTTSPFLNLAATLCDTGRDAEAIPLLESVSRRRTRLVGDQDSSTVTAMLHWASALCRCGLSDQAASVVRQVDRPAQNSVLEVAFAFVDALLDKAAGRPTKAELALSRLASTDLLPRGLRAEITCQLAAGFLQEGRPDEASRWSRIAAVEAKSLARVSPASFVRIATTTARVELLCGRWSEANRIADDAMVVSAPYHASFASQRSEFDAIRTLASTPGESKWKEVLRSFKLICNWSLRNCLKATPVGRLVEHAIALEEQPAALEALGELLTARVDAPREWHVLRASLAVLIDDPSAAAAWQDLANNHKSRASEEQELAENLARELMDANRTASPVIQNGSVRKELLAAFSSQRGGQAMAEAIESAEGQTAKQLADSIHDDEGSPGHVLDDLF